MSQNDPKLAAAVQLGWRVAELYALVDDTGEPVCDTLLPSHGSLDPADQLELQLRAAAGDASRAGVKSKQASLEAFVELAREAPTSPEAAEAFRARLRCCHIEVQKDLWAIDEAAGEAYELGTSLSDTYGRICRAYRYDEKCEAREWEEVFAPARIERIKKLLDDLHSRLNPSGVAIVCAQLDMWRDQVADRLGDGRVPERQQVRDGLRRQTIIWRQLLAGDKEPEAYLDREARSELRDELRHLIWRRYRAWVVPMAAALFLLVLTLPWLINAYQEGLVKTGLTSAAVAAAAAVGITRASVLFTLRGRLDQWSQMLWSRAIAQKVVDETLTLESVLPPVPAEHRFRVRMPSALATRFQPAMVPSHDRA